MISNRFLSNSGLGVEVTVGVGVDDTGFGLGCIVGLTTGAGVKVLALGVGT
jgi:hypothetical protein